MTSIETIRSSISMSKRWAFSPDPAMAAHEGRLIAGSILPDPRYVRIWGAANPLSVSEMLAGLGAGKTIGIGIRFSRVRIFRTVKRA